MEMYEVMIFPLVSKYMDFMTSLYQLICKAGEVPLSPPFDGKNLYIFKAILTN